MLRDLGAHPAVALASDFYGAGGAVAELEARTASLLGKERGLFVINGVTAQLAALKSHAVRAAADAVVLSRMSHIDLDEQNALERVAGLKLVRIGGSKPFRLQDLSAIREPLAAVVVELPMRRAGYLLPQIDELFAISDHCRARGIALHIDGARLWESSAGYGVEPAELAALADSVYVSFYKGLGGLGGAVVAGSDPYIASLLPWKSRFGGDLFTAFPYAIAALSGLETHLPKMPEYVARARALAARLDNRFLLNPERPQANAFQLHLPGTSEALRERNRAFARERGVWLFNLFVDAPIEGWVMTEVVIGNASETHDIDQAAEWIEAFAAQTTA